MKEQPRIRVTVEIPLLAPDGSEDRCQFYREWEVHRRGQSIHAAVKRCVIALLQTMEPDCTRQHIREIREIRLPAIASAKAGELRG